MQENSIICYVITFNKCGNVLFEQSVLFEGSLDDLRHSARQAGMSADNLEDVFLSIVEQDNAVRRQRAKL